MSRWLAAMPTGSQSIVERLPRYGEMKTCNFEMRFFFGPVCVLRSDVPSVVVGRTKLGLRADVEMTTTVDVMWTVAMVVLTLSVNATTMTTLSELSETANSDDHHIGQPSTDCRVGERTSLPILTTPTVS